MYLYLASFATGMRSNSSCLMVAPSLSHSVAGSSRGILQPFGTVLNLMTLRQRKALDLSFAPCARYARSYLTCYFKVISRAWMHTETAALAKVRRKEGQGRVRMNGKRLFVLLAMHWKNFELQKQCAGTISPVMQTRLCKTRWIFSNAGMTLRR